MNFAYVLVSDNNDIYYEQMLVSLISLKHWNTDACVSLVVDDDTANTFVSPMRKRHEKYVDEVIIKTFSADKSKLYRSRYLKTTLREILNGDFLYIDTDTIVCGKINPSAFTWDVMGVDDCHQLPQNHSGWSNLSKEIRASGFSENGIDHYINGGVLWMKDCDKSHQLSSLWHSLWNQSLEKGIFVDQPSLNEANRRMSKCIKLLPGEYNCQISSTLRYLYQAKIIHCFATTVSCVEKHRAAFYFLNPDFYRVIKNKEISSEDKSLIFNAKSAFDEGETILLGKHDSDIYRNLSKTNLFGFLYCLFNSKRGRWLFDFMDEIVGVVTSLFWKK